MKKTHTHLTAPGIELLEGRIAPAAANLDLSSLSGANGVQINGAAAYDYAGFSVSGAGDINGDGIGDILVGGHQVDANGEDTGAAYVIFGRAGGFAGDLNLAALDGTNGFRVGGEAAGDQFGYSVSAAGDVNGDGFDDIIIGAPQASPNGAASGAAYVLFGHAGAFAAQFNAVTLDGSNGFKIAGAAAGDQAGGSVSGAGDVNGDGFADVVVGAAWADGAAVNSGASYVVLGHEGAFSATVELSALDGTTGFRISGEAVGDGTGSAVSDAGDVNRDGFDDVIIGAPSASTNGIHTGVAYVVFGKGGGFAADVALSTLDGTNGFRINGQAEDDLFGTSVSGIGDFDGDGFGDAIIGAPGESAVEEYAGAAYVVFGRPVSPSPTLEATELNGWNGFKIIGEKSEDYAGAAVSGAGDINGDGLNDLVIGAYGADPHGDYSGAAYVVYGKAAHFSPTLRLSSLNGKDGVQISGDGTGSYAGSAVSGLGDVNGDGVDDLMIGAPGSSPNGSYSGTSYVIYGRGDATPPVKSTVVMKDPDGDIVTITLEGAWLTRQNVILGPDGSIEMIDLSGLASTAQKAIGSKPMNLTINVRTPIGGLGDGLTKIGLLNAPGLAFGKVKLEGSLGQIFAGDGSGKSAIQSLLLAGDFGKSTTNPSPLSRLVGGLNKLFVGGSFSKGALQVAGALKTVKIIGDFGEDAAVGQVGAIAAAAAPSAAAPAEGNPFAAGSLLADLIGSIKIGGSMKGGAINVDKGLGSFSMIGDFLGGDLTSGGNIHVVKVRGQISTNQPDNPITITAKDGIDRMVVKGDVSNALILAGYNKAGEPVNPDAHIGKVIVKGNWSQSSLVAGVVDSPEDGFGQNDVVIPGDTTPSIISGIAKVIIKGTASGSPAGGDHFGIVAQQIGSVSIGGASVDLQQGVADNILLDPTNGDFRLVELGPA